MQSAKRYPIEHRFASSLGVGAHGGLFRRLYNFEQLREAALA